MKRIKSKIFLLKNPNFYNIKKSQDPQKPEAANLQSATHGKAATRPADGSPFLGNKTATTAATATAQSLSFAHSGSRNGGFGKFSSPPHRNSAGFELSTFFTLPHNQVESPSNGVNLNRKEWDQLSLLFYKMKKVNRSGDGVFLTRNQSNNNNRHEASNLSKPGNQFTFSDRFISSSRSAGTAAMSNLSDHAATNHDELDADEKELKKMVEKLHDFLLKKRNENKWKWSENVYELLMFYHSLLGNFRAVKRLFEDYQNEFNPFASSDFGYPIQYYLFALWKCENIDYFVSFVSKNVQELCCMKLTVESHALILQIASQTEKRKLFYIWFSVLRKELYLLANQSIENRDKNDPDFTILSKALDYSTAFHSMDLSLEIFTDLKKIRRSFVKQKNIQNNISMNPIEMARLFEKSIRADVPSQTESSEEPDPVINSNNVSFSEKQSNTDQSPTTDGKQHGDRKMNRVETGLLENEKNILTHYRKWHSPLMPIPQLCSVLRVLAHQKDSEKIYSFFQEQVCSKEFLYLYWARQISISKKRVADILEESQQSLSVLKSNQQENLMGKMSTKKWLKNVPLQDRQSQVKQSQEKQNLKASISWANRRLKRNLQVPAHVGEEGPLKYTYQAIVESWRASNIEEEGKELELDNLLKRLVQLEIDLIQTLSIVEFLSIKSQSKN